MGGGRGCSEIRLPPPTAVLAKRLRGHSSSAGLGWGGSPVPNQANVSHRAPHGRAKTH